MITRNNLPIMAVIAVSLIIVFAGVKLISPTGHAVAAQPAPDFNGSTELVFVDDISCKEWNLCFTGWQEQITTTDLTSSSGDVTEISQTHQVPVADSSCVVAVYNSLSDNDITISDFSSNVPIPPECLVQKDPAIQSIDTGHEENITYCYGDPVPDCDLLFSPKCKGYNYLTKQQCVYDGIECAEGSVCQQIDSPCVCRGTETPSCEVIPDALACADSYVIRLINPVKCDPCYWTGNTSDGICLPLGQFCALPDLS